MPLLSHAVQFYQDDTFLIESVSAFIKSGVEEGATPPSRFAALPRPFTPSLLETNVRFFDAPTMLSTFMKDDWPSKNGFMREVGYIVQQAALKGPVRIFGEMVALLWAQGHARAAIRLEELWNELATEETFSLLCAYPKSAFSDHKEAHLFQQVCQTHTHVHTSSGAPQPNTP